MPEQNNNDGISYLMALKQSSHNDPLTAPARSGSGEQAENSGQFEGPNKRRAPRYKCQGSIELREEGCDVRTWATFTDISLHGCYVEAQATYPAGTVLNMKLEANGVRIETKGNVRVNYPYLGMGIAFVGMTEETVLRLRQMLGSISRGCAIVGPGVASNLPSTAHLSGVPPITDPLAAVQEVIAFFESQQLLMRDDFLRLLRRSQSTDRNG